MVLAPSDINDLSLRMSLALCVRFLTYSEMAQRAEREEQRAELERKLKEQERQRAEQERQLKEQAEAKIKMLYLRLQELGIDPEQL